MKAKLFSIIFILLNTLPFLLAQKDTLYINTKGDKVASDIASRYLIKTLNAQTSDLKEECMRTIKAMPQWTPARLDGQNIAMTYLMPIKFILE